MAEAYSVTVRFVTVAALIEREFRKESRALGLNAGEMLVLDALRRLGPPYESSPAQLKDRFLISFAGIGKRFERLVQHGYVVRHVSQLDRRSQVVRLTSTGLELLRNGFRNRHAPHIQALLALPAAERKQLTATLRRLQKEIERAAVA